MRLLFPSSDLLPHSVREKINTSRSALFPLLLSDFFAAMMTEVFGAKQPFCAKVP